MTIATANAGSMNARAAADAVATTPTGGTTTGAMTGAQYIESLRDGRDVRIAGKRIDDVTTHPAMRNSIRSIAAMYDALHAGDERAGVLTCETDTGSGTRTHRAFRVARSREDLIATRDAIAAWSRMSFGWMGRSPDYKASLTTTFGAAADFYGPYADNARRWYAFAQERVPFICHAIVNPPIDRDKPMEQCRDVYVHVERETDAGLIVSGAKVVATSAAMTNWTFIGQTGKASSEAPDMALAFMLRTGAPGVTLICRTSYEQTSAERGVFDAPLSSRFDENDAILVMDKVLVPWEDVLIHRDVKRVRAFFTGTGFVNNFLFHGCTRLGVKLDFLCGLLAKALACTGGDEHRGNQVLLGEAIAWRHMIWSLSDAMCHNPDAWGDGAGGAGGAVLPSRQAALSSCVFAPECYVRVREIIQRTVASGLIYLPSGARDLQDAETDALLSRFVRGSHGIGHEERIKTMKLLWDAVGSEFAGRHELYERCYAGSWEDVRLQVLGEAQRFGRMAKMNELVEECMRGYGVGGVAE
jgi:4-hydroxyphenylacetate 3-monooxygenase